MSTQEDRLTEIADAIRYAEGSTALIPALSFASRIRALSGGGGSTENYDLQAKTVTPTKSQQLILPDSDYYGLSSVTVGAIPAKYQDVSGVTAGAADVLAGKVLVDKSGNPITGTMANNGAVNVLVESGKSYTIPKGYHNGSGKVTAEAAPEYTTEKLTVTANGNYSAPAGVNGYNPVEVNVPSEEPVIKEIEITANGRYTAPADVDGYNPVVVSIPSEEPTEPIIQPLEVAENGTYTAPEGVDGYNPIKVLVTAEAEKNAVISVSSDDETLGTVSGGGTFDVGATVSLEADIADGARLVGWYENGELVSEVNPFQFVIPNPDRVFVAKFRQGPPSGYNELTSLYHKASGNLHLNVPYTLNSRVDITLEIASASNTNYAAQIWGDAARSNLLGTFKPYYTTFRLYSSATGAGTAEIITVPNFQNKKVTISFDSPNGILSVDDVVYGSGYQNFFPAFSSIYLAPVSNSSYYLKMYVYRVKVYESGVLSSDFVPCTDSSGNIGLYDMVQNTFVQASTTSWQGIT